jgi:hypothetical protein
MQAIESAVFAVAGKDCGANGKRVNSRQAKEKGVTGQQGHKSF